MFEIDKERFGAFLAAQRKKKGYTQKELAQRLFVSDKAVSKWECAASMPDISLLIPLSEILGVTVTELLEGRELQKETEMKVDHVEDLVKTTLTLLDEDTEQSRSSRKKRGLFFGAAMVVVLLEVPLFPVFGIPLSWKENHIFPHELLSVLFGAYFWLFIKEKLPAYYDENKISFYGDGIFRMNMAGLHFNNSNWPYIVLTGRIWSVATALILPLVYMILSALFPAVWAMFYPIPLLALYLGSLFVPLFVVGKKYE